MEKDEKKEGKPLPPWTPGPWSVAGTMYVEQEGGRLIARAQHIAQTNPKNDQREIRTVQANASLISAAPEMANALAWVVSEYDRRDDAYFMEHDSHLPENKSVASARAILHRIGYPGF